MEGDRHGSDPDECGRRGLLNAQEAEGIRERKRTCLLYKTAPPDGHVSGKLGQQEGTGWVHRWGMETEESGLGTRKASTQ